MQGRCLLLRSRSVILNIRVTRGAYFSCSSAAWNMASAFFQNRSIHHEQHSNMSLCGTSDYRGTDVPSHFDPERHLCCPHHGSTEKCERLLFRRSACMLIGILRYDSRGLFLWACRFSDIRSGSVPHDLRNSGIFRLRISIQNTEILNKRWKDIWS